MRQNTPEERAAFLALRDRALAKLRETQQDASVADLTRHLGLRDASALVPTWHYPASEAALRAYLEDRVYVRPPTVAERLASDIAEYPDDSHAKRAARLGCHVVTVYRAMLGAP